MQHVPATLKNGEVVTLWWFDGGPFPYGWETAEASHGVTIHPGEVGIEHAFGMRVVRKEEIVYWIGEEAIAMVGLA